jgi:hypothetical protein
VRILPLANRVDSSALSYQAAHRRVFVPNVAKLYLGNLTKREVRRRVLFEVEQGQLTD